jgi:hypothetical protein
MRVIFVVVVHLLEKFSDFSIFCLNLEKSTRKNIRSPGVIFENGMFTNKNGEENNENNRILVFSHTIAIVPLKE